MKISRFFIVLLLFLFPLQLLADELNPAIYLILDTSGSMLQDPDGNYTYGDGSVEQPSISGFTSRLYSAKNAITTVVNAYGEVRWGFARFQQNSGINYICMCTSEDDDNPSCPGGTGLWAPEDNCRICDYKYSGYLYTYDRPNEHDRLCVNYAGGLVNGCRDLITNELLTGADILVELGEHNSTDILKWIDHHEYVPGDPVGSGTDPEIRAIGGTPLGGSLQTIYDKLSNEDIHNDTRRGCRPYTVILLTDGSETCDTDPESAAAQLLETPDLQSSCSSNSECPSGVCSSGHCIYEVKTYVLAFGLSASQMNNANDIAAAGGTGEAIPAQNEEELSAAIAGIIASSIRYELCNGVDDDCDGYVDEDFPVGSTCNNGLLGECYREGNYICTSDETGVECDAPYISPSDEICDGLDNNCNGLVDDGITCPVPVPEICNGVDDDSDPSTPDGADDSRVGQPCGNDIGICEPGITICSGGSIVCDTTQGPEPEICDNLDNDCDGLTDENLSQSCENTTTFGTCTGLAYCSEGVWGECTARTPEPEECNNFDDNCDGNIDENLQRNCENRNAYGVCLGTEICSAGVWSTCDATEPALDICNGIDDDCDGDIDDSDPQVGQPCESGCGVYVCTNGTLTCDGSSGDTEVCDGIDNDCDGEIDEELQQECEISNEYGVCPGLEICTNGIWNACDAKTPSQEQCNGLDDNCDGNIDEDAICPNPDDICYEGQCRSKCGSSEFSCPPTDECVDYPEDEDIKICMPIIQECGLSICKLTEVCQEGECIDPCDPNPCGTNEECSANFRWRDGDPVENQYICNDVSCAVYGHYCESGNFCWEGTCVEDPCSTAECGDSEYCKREQTSDGSWVATCKSVCTCNSGEICNSEGKCEVDLCVDVNCDFGKVCQDGVCVDDSCQFVQCKQGEACIDGSCIWDPCSTAKCPAYATCERVKNSDGTLSSICTPKDQYYTPAVVKGRVTSGGGCSTNSGNKYPPIGFMLILLLGIVIKFVKFSQIRKFLAVLPVFTFIFFFTSCDRSVYVIKDDAILNTDVPDSNINNNNSNNNINNNNNCEPSEEVCDGVDNDCDGVVDNYWIPASEGGEGHFSDDPANCGSCNNICAYYQGEGICTNGQCQLNDCKPYYFDLNQDASDGCEYRCDTMGNTSEVCDGMDNDCDGIADEYWIPISEGGEGHFSDDAANCGFCGVTCTDLYPNGVGGCGEGLCVLDHCEAGWIDANGFMSDGCETECVVSNGGVEICDGLDNDCDGIVDEDDTGLPLSVSCYTGEAGTNGVGVCSEGIMYCHSGIWGPVCEGEITPATERCDGQDNDCNGSSDETFDFDNDINNCGSCGHSCLTAAPPAHMYPIGCSVGTCQYECEYGYHNINGVLSDGCEYECTPTASSGVEYCDGIDNDCDGSTDESSDLQLPPSNYCRTGGLCGSSVSVNCEVFNGNKQWVCQYPSGVERISDSPNLVVTYETLCDGYDGDCDGTIDDDFLPIKGSACEDSDIGRCKGTGTIVCKSDHSGTECNITDKESPINEICNGEDDDCDGMVDEPAWNPGTNSSYVVDDVETINVDGHYVYVYKYEASRPEATSSSAGSGSDLRSCSKSNVLPWAKVTYAQAQLACAKAGMRLCNAEEWQKSCEGSGKTYPYGNSYSSSTCNGVDYSTTYQAVSTGSLSSCDSDYGIFDLSGNLKEWTQTLVTYTEDGIAVYETRGGSYNENEYGLTCTNEDANYTEDTLTPYIGFRCCTTCGNNAVESGEACDDGNDVNGDGCDALCAVDNASQTCGNGIVEGSEECDDGNRMPLDGCSPTCKNED